MNSIWLAKQFYNVYMAAIVSIISRRGLRILKCVVETNLIRVSYHCISRSFHFNSYLKQLYISNKTERFSYKSGCSVTRIEAFRRRADLGYGV